MSDILPDFSAAINSLKAKAGEFVSVYNTFISFEPIVRNDSALYSEWLDVKRRAEAVQGTISWINAQVDGAVSWIGNTTGLSGISSIGAIPLIPVAYVVGAVAALGMVINSMLNTIYKAQDLKRRLDMIANGTLSEDMLNSATPGLFGDLSGTLSGALKLAIIGGAIYFIVPKLLEGMKK